MKKNLILSVEAFECLNPEETIHLKGMGASNVSNEMTSSTHHDTSSHHDSSTCYDSSTSSDHSDHHD